MTSEQLIHELVEVLKRELVPEHGRRVHRPSDDDAATQAALEEERDARDEALS